MSKDVGFEEWIQREEPQYHEDLTNTELYMYRRIYAAECRYAILGDSNKELSEFFTELVKECNLHYREYEAKGWNPEAWKHSDLMGLHTLFLDSAIKHGYEDLKKNPSHFIDIAIFTFFCYTQFLKSGGG